jgi:hypothetical protein
VSTAPLDFLRTMWTRPRLTVRRVLDCAPGWLVVPHVGAASLAATFAEGESVEGGWTLDRLPWAPELALGLAIGLALWLFVAFWFTMFGRALGGRGTFRELMSSVGWGVHPLAAALPFAFALALVRGQGREWTELILSSVVATLGLWSVVCIVQAVAEAHRISTRRAVVCALLVGLLHLGIAILASDVFNFEGPPMPVPAENGGGVSPRGAVLP